MRRLYTPRAAAAGTSSSSKRSCTCGQGAGSLYDAMILSKLSKKGVLKQLRAASPLWLSRQNS
eukprot:1140250-Pelagomonas_calceolata.AAC.2